MAKNRLFVQLPKKEIKNKPVELPYFHGEEFVGTFKLSVGSVQFVAKGRTYGAAISLDRLAELITQHQNLKGRTGGRRVHRGRPKGQSKQALAG